MVSAKKDVGLPGAAGVDLQRIQIIKGWVDENNVTHERVVDIAGDANNGATVDAENCALLGRGAAQLCAVWQDDQFDPGQDVFYYARVLENPSCRWSTRQCQAAGVNPFADNCAQQAERETELAQQQGASGDVYGKCCINPEEMPFYSPVVQERAWTSPIWYSAGK